MSSRFRPAPSIFNGSRVPLHPYLDPSNIVNIKAAAEMWACATVPKRLELLNYVVLEIEANADLYHTQGDDEQVVELDFDIDSL